MKVLTSIDIQGDGQSAFEVYADESKEQTVGFIFDEQDAILLEKALMDRKNKRDKPDRPEKKAGSYCLIVGGYHEFQEMVCRKMKSGWQPFGSPFVTAMCYCQAMIKND